MAGAAVIHLGYVGAAFAWVLTPEGLLTWEDRRAFGRGVTVGAVPGNGSSWRSADAHVEVHGDGAFALSMTAQGQPVRFRAAVDRAGSPATLVTDTAGGGWNVTEKAAGYELEASLRIDDHDLALSGLGWRDWTTGRQDRRTSWMWAAAAGTVAGRRLGFNVSTGMNAAGPGEDVLWWDGHPQPLEVEEFTRGESSWRLRGRGWSLEFVPDAERAAEERLGPVSSRYVQPIGRFSGSLPGPAGEPVAVQDVLGVTEEHVARW